jgi:hypothetical protein
VREYRSADGARCLWYDEDEIEQIMEDELRRAGLLPTPDSSVVDLEAFLEGHLKVTFDQYAALPAEVLGLTEFDPRRAPTVRINRVLTGTAMDSDWCPPGIEGRWRATVAHEAAHVILHRILYDEALNQASLFTADSTAAPAPKLQRCLKRDLSHRRGNADWREVQANRGMAALLMPKRQFTKAARAVGVGSTSEEIDAACRALASQFGVSRQATTIRLNTLGFIGGDQADSLFDLTD